MPGIYFWLACTSGIFWRCEEKNIGAVWCILSCLQKQIAEHLRDWKIILGPGSTPSCSQIWASLVFHLACGNFSKHYAWAWRSAATVDWLWCLWSAAAKRALRTFPVMTTWWDGPADAEDLHNLHIIWGPSSLDFHLPSSSSMAAMWFRKRSNLHNCTTGWWLSHPGWIKVQAIWKFHVQEVECEYVIIMFNGAFKHLINYNHVFNLKCFKHRNKSSLIQD